MPTSGRFLPSRPERAGGPQAAESTYTVRARRRALHGLTSLVTPGEVPAAPSLGTGREGLVYASGRTVLGPAANRVRGMGLGPCCANKRRDARGVAPNRPIYRNCGMGQSRAQRAAKARRTDRTPGGPSMGVGSFGHCGAATGRAGEPVAALSQEKSPATGTLVSDCRGLLAAAPHPLHGDRTPPFRRAMHCPRASARLYSGG
jgi:hypothetical protein